MDSDLDIWLTSTQELRTALLVYSKALIPSDSGERQLDVSKALNMGQDAGDLLADADLYLSQALAAAILAARADHDAATAKIIAKGAVAGIQRIRDGIATCYQTIKDRRYTLLSLGRW